jgi:hypothetical protein
MWGKATAGRAPPRGFRVAGDLPSADFPGADLNPVTCAPAQLRGRSRGSPGLDPVTHFYQCEAEQVQAQPVGR